MNDNKIDNDEYNKLVKVYEEYKKNKKNKLSVFVNLKLIVFSYNNIFSIIILVLICIDKIRPICNIRYGVISSIRWKWGITHSIRNTSISTSVSTSISIPRIKLSFLCT